MIEEEDKEERERQGGGHGPRVRGGNDTVK